MTSSPPISKSEEREPWWRRWLEPVVVVTIISALLVALVTVGMMAFQSLKGDLRDVDANLRETITATDIRLREAIIATDARLRETIAATDIRLREAIAASETRLRDEMREFKAEVKADNGALNEKLDRVLERLPAAEK